MAKKKNAVGDYILYKSLQSDRRTNQESASQTGTPILDVFDDKIDRWVDRIPAYMYLVLAAVGAALAYILLAGSGSSWPAEGSLLFGAVVGLAIIPILRTAYELFKYVIVIALGLGLFFIFAGESFFG
ncbi:hypothetical protein [Pseudovibrio exalbescens]|uniref:hypothetical protein n=1 Tax=Pseudovibrio exalbescens TaxID=197461 RepID=UPI000C99AAE7|nr:hypothetical protein [Pseudovibrio exalbescens]